MIRVRRALGLLIASALFTAQLAVPGLAIAQAGVPAWACSPADIASAASSTARGPVSDSRGLVREKDLGQVAQDLPAGAKGKARAGFVATVPIYFHVITDGAVGNVTDRSIRDQVAVMNAGYSGSEGGFDSGFSFTLAGISRTDNAAWFALSGKSSEADMKIALHQGGNNALNVYSTSGAGYLGWAYYPSIVTGSQAYLDGVVLDWETMPGASTTFAGKYDLGKTLTHESGHWFNLAHTFDGGCNRGDFVDDTPAEKTPTSGCPEGKDTCRAPGFDPIHNYMDYSYDSCYTQFTPGQAQRMQDAWLLYRAP